jgi:ATP synthase protein I
MSQTPEELGQKIKEAQSRQKPVSTGLKTGTSGGGKALRAATDLVAALAVGVVLGYWIDRWLGTKPFGIILFLFLGFAAGFLNLYRAQTRQDAKNDKDKS